MAYILTDFQMEVVNKLKQLGQWKPNKTDSKIRVLAVHVTNQMSQADIGEMDEVRTELLETTARLIGTQRAQEFIQWLFARSLEIESSPSVQVTSPAPSVGENTELLECTQASQSKHKLQCGSEQENHSVLHQAASGERTNEHATASTQEF